MVKVIYQLKSPWNQGLVHFEAIWVSEQGNCKVFRNVIPAPQALQ